MKIRFINVRRAALPLALAAAFPTFSVAQNAPKSQLPETVVTASRNPQLLASALPHATVMSREDIERSQATDLVSLLEREAGVQKTQNGGLGSVSTVFLRGSAALQTLVLIDGVPQNKQDASGAVSLEHLMLDQVERVEIVRGNVSAIYGSGATGGVIQIFTRTGNRKPTASLAIQAGPRAFRKVTGSFSTQVGNTTMSADLSRVSTSGFSAVNPAQYPNANPDADGYKNTSLNFAITHQFSKSHSFGARGFKVNGDVSYDSGFGTPSDVQSAGTRLSQFSVFSDNKFGDWRSRLTLSEQSDKSQLRDNAMFGFNGSFTTRATVLGWVNTIALSDNWLATAGLEQQRQRVEAFDEDTLAGNDYRQQRSTTALFAGLEGKLVGGDVQFNVRRDKVGNLDATTGFLGYGYPISKNIKLMGSLSTAFNAPPLGYLFAPGFGNPMLKPEYAKSREIGAQYEAAGQLIRASYFDTRTRNQLGYDPSIGAFGAFNNVDRTRNSGTEMSYKGRFGATDLRAGLTLQDPKNDLTGERLQRRAATMWTAGVSHELGAWRLGADLLHSGARPDAYFDAATFNSVNTTLPSYTRLNLSAQYRVTPEVLLKARLDNAVDAKYQTVYGYNQQPRSLYFGAVWTPRQ